MRGLLTNPDKVCTGSSVDELRGTPEEDLEPHRKHVLAYGPILVSHTL